MPKPWDDAMKKLIGSSPQDFASWVLRGAHIDKQLPSELNVENIYADGLLHGWSEERELLLHFEFQSSIDPLMAERLLEYNVLASRQYNYLPVLSCVIYLRGDGDVPPSPFVRRLPDGEETTRFHYKIIQVKKMKAEEFLQLGLSGLFPLMPLTKDGARREVVEMMIEGLVAAKKTDTLWIGYALASKELTEDLPWVKRRFVMFSDILRDSPVYQEVLEEGIEKGVEKGRLQAFRQAVLDVVVERFPKIVPVAKKQINTIDDAEILRSLVAKMSTIQSAKEAKQLLLDVADIKENSE